MCIFSLFPDYPKTCSKIFIHPKNGFVNYEVIYVKKY